MNNAVMFSKASDEWSTPQGFYEELDAEFNFTLDAACSEENCKAPYGMTAADDALKQPWEHAFVWLNPPYSKCREFVGKAAAEAENGVTTVCLVPSRTDTRWWHDYVWDREKHRPRPGVEIRFVKGRLKFGGATAGAPFPSVVIIFRGQ